MTEQELKKFYNENPDFKRYVDEYCRTGKYTVEEVLKHKMVEAVALVYRESKK